MEIRKVSETASKMTLAWDPVPGAAAGYRGRDVTVSKWTQTQGTQMVFAKGASVEIQALGVVDSGTYPPSDPEPEPPPDALRYGLSTYRLGSLAPPSGPGRYDFLIGNWSRASLYGAVPAPTKSLHYFSAISLKSGSDGWHYGVTLEQARANGWVLKDAAGNDVMNRNYGLPIGDLGSAGYQQQMVSNMRARIAATAVDGIFWDDVLWSFKALTGGQVPAKYPTQQAWLAAVVSFAKAMREGLSEFVVGFNATGYTPGDGRSDTGELDRLLHAQLAPYADLLQTEYWLWHSAWGAERVRKSGPNFDQHWDEWLLVAEQATRLGYVFAGNMYSTNATMRDYVLASALLVTDGSHVVFSWTPGSNTTNADPWNASYDKLATLAKPLGARQKNGSRWERAFEGGLVWVDPTAGTAGIS